MGSETENLPVPTDDAKRFELLQRQVKAFALSSMLPKSYAANDQVGFANRMIAADISQRLGVPLMTVMQNLYVIEGKPAWSSTFVIAAVNGCGRFTTLRFKLDVMADPIKEIGYTYYVKENGNRKAQQGQAKDVPDIRCYAYCEDRESGEALKGPTVTTTMAVHEGWYTKPGSKWKTMPELMIQYRAAAFFARLYAPEILAGLHSADEVEDFSRPSNRPERTAAKIIDAPLSLTGEDSTNAEPDGLGFDPNDDIPDDF